MAEADDDRSGSQGPLVRCLFRRQRVSSATGVLASALVVVVGFALFAPGASAGSARSSGGLQTITLYSLATQEQFLDHNDDEARGWALNPFGLRDKKVQADENEDKGGPYPGDVALFSFNLYSDQGLKTPAGTAIYTCFYGFNRNAFCDAIYHLSGGTLVGAGSFGFDATTFALAITSGTSKYDTMTGDVESAPGGGRAQRLSFLIQPD